MEEVQTTKKYIRTIGRRKESVAQVRLFTEGDGKIEINGKEMVNYFTVPSHQQKILTPFKETGTERLFDITVKVKGGGITGQADSIRMAIARALIKHNPEWRTSLKKLGLLTRDARKKERKKPGLKSARRAPQWSKR